MPKGLREILGGGADIIQLRCKDMPSDRFLEYAITLRRLTKTFGILFIVNDRADIALASGADGLHIGQDDITPAMSRKILGENRLIGLSTHSMRQVEEAHAIKDIDYIGIGPIFKTSLKPDAKPIGLKTIREILKRRNHKPFFAIGGITEKNIGTAVSFGADSIAISNAVFNSKNPVDTIKRFREILS